MDLERQIGTLSFWVIAAFVAAAPALVFHTLSQLARMSGWTELAGFYAGGQRVDGARRRFQSMQMGREGSGLVSFKNNLTLTVTSYALELSSFFPFDIGHKMLAIPIADLSATPKRMMFYSAVDLRAARAPSVIIRMPASAVRWIEEQSGARLLAPEMEMAAS